MERAIPSRKCSIKATVIKEVNDQAGLRFAVIVFQVPKQILKKENPRNPIFQVKILSQNKRFSSNFFHIVQKNALIKLYKRHLPGKIVWHFHAAKSKIIIFTLQSYTKNAYLSRCTFALKKCNLKKYVLVHYLLLVIYFNY